MGFDQFEICITDKTRVVVVPHLYGYGADMPRIVGIGERKGYHRRGRCRPGNWS